MDISDQRCKGELKDGSTSQQDFILARHQANVPIWDNRVGGVGGRIYCRVHMCLPVQAGDRKTEIAKQTSHTLCIDSESRWNMSEVSKLHRKTIYILFALKDISGHGRQYLLTA